MKAEIFTHNRDISMDMLRVLACLMVIGAHVGAAGKVAVPFGESQWIYILIWGVLCHFPAPLFFMISGAFSSKTDPGNGIKKALYFFLIFLASAVFYYFFEAILNNTQISLYGLIYGIYYYMYHLWFLLDMVVVMLLSPFLNRITGRSLNYAIALMVIFLILFKSIGFFFPANDLIVTGSDFISRLVPSGLLFCGYYLIGKSLYINRDSLPFKKLPVFIAFLLASVLEFLIILKTNIDAGELDETFFQNNSIFIFIQSVTLFYLFLNAKTPKNITKFVCSASDKTFGIYIIHVAVLNVLTKIGVTPAGVNSLCQGSLAFTIIMVPIEIIVIMLISWLLAFPLSYIGKVIKNFAYKLGDIIWSQSTNETSVSQ